MRDDGLPSDLIARALGLPPVEPRWFGGVATLHEQVREGDLFVALTCRDYDGARFVGEATARGAAGVVAPLAELPAAARGVPLFRCDDGLSALRTIAAAWRRELSLPVVAVVGSAGKTSTTAMVASLLRGGRPPALSTIDDSNGFIGIALTVLRLRRHHRAAVVEIGIDAPGAMIEHLRLVDPTAAIVTSIGAEHLNKLRDLETIAREETLALRYVAARDGVAVVNLDDPHVCAHASQLVGRRVGYSLEGRAMAGIDELVHGVVSGGELEVTGCRPPRFRVALPMPGHHNARNFLGAIAAAHAVGVDADGIRRGVATFVPPPARSEIREHDGAVVICDYYNATPPSVVAGLRLLGDGDPRAARIACLGDMGDLGDDAERCHRALADALADVRVDRVLLIGPLMRWLDDELRRRGRGDLVEHLPSHDAVVERLRAEVRRGDRVLLKGGRAVTLERVWERWSAGQTPAS
jgi:UDP-N-acetylmuramoyl-tripeptide--D-alanyl-D-alanine ligase